MSKSIDVGAVRCGLGLAVALLAGCATPEPITLSDDGRLFVSQCVLGDQLYEIDPDFLADGSALRELDPVSGAEVHIFQILDDGDTVEPPRPVVGGLAGPEGIAAAEDGTLYVVEEDAGRVTQVNPQTGTTTSVADGLALSGLERGALGDSTTIGSLSGVTVGNGALFVSDHQGNRVYRIEP